MLANPGRFQWKGIWGLLLAGLVAALMRPGLAYAGGVVGNGTPVSCTEAAFNAALVDGGLITFNCGGAKTITFTDYKQISANTTIDGGGVITLSGGNTASLFQVFDSRRLTLQNITLAEGRSGSLAAGAIENFGTTIISNSTLRDNVSTTNGGAIVNYGTLNLSNTTLSKNQAENAGGGIYNDGGVVNIIDSQVLENVVPQGIGGGGLANQSGTINIQNSAFEYNSSLTRGGAIRANSGTLNIQNSTFSQNSSGSGGAIRIDQEATAFITASLITNNSATNGAGGINNLGHLVISQTTLSLNRAGDAGGGIYGATGETVLNGVTVSGNTAEGNGGGIFVSGGIRLTNSTVSGNIAGGRGGGLSITQPELIELTNVTLSGNHATAGGGGIYQVAGTTSLNFVSVVSNTGGGLYASGGDMSLKNTVLANNSVGNCDGSSFISLGHNLANDDSCNAALNQPTDKSGTAVALPLGALANNGGPTLTHLPLNGNPAINGGVCVDGISTDQRGLPRPVETVCDVGAVEVGSMGGRVAVYLPIVVR